MALPIQIDERLAALGMRLARIFHTLSGFFGRPRTNRRSVIESLQEMRAKSKTAAVLPIARTLQTTAIAAKIFAHAVAAMREECEMSGLGDVDERFVRGSGPGGQKIKMFKLISTILWRRPGSNDQR